MRELLSVACRDECGAWAADVEAAGAAGWSFLSIRGAYRCGSCAASLRAAAGFPGTEPPGGFVDPLPPTSRGALRKETASTILPVAVRP